MRQTSKDSARDCPNCGAGINRGRLFLEANLQPEKISRFSFASRKLPELMCHEMFQCADCDLVYASRPPPRTDIETAYHNADFDSHAEADDAAATYFDALTPLLHRLPRRDAALEIGCGTGAFLEMLLVANFLRVEGLEPSSAAISAARPPCIGLIRQTVFRENDFSPESFDLVCCFMTLEHVMDPRLLVEGAFRLLRPGGALAVVTHDYRGFVNRLLGRKSPIVDIEHLQLFSKRSVKSIFENSGFCDIEISELVNEYDLVYWLKLSPLPKAIKLILINFIQSTFGSRALRIRVNVGNIMTIGRRPN